MSIRPMTTLAVCLGTLALQQAAPTTARAQPITVDGRAGDWRPADPRVSAFDDPRDIAAPPGGMVGDSGFDIRQLMLFVEPDGGLYAAYRTYGVAGDGDGDGDPDGGPGDGDREFVDLLIDLDENGVTDLVVSQSFVPLADSVTIFAPNGSDLSADEARRIPMMGELRVVDVFELTVPGFAHLLAARPNGDRSARYCVQAMLGSGNDGIGEDVIDGFSVGEACGGGGGDFIPVCPDLDAVELCNDFDDDCDLLIDEGLGLGDACAVGVGACERSGVLICAADGGVVCDVPEGDPTPERCDGIDNDCDGMVDEDFPDLGLPCDVGLGACNAEGIIVCAADGGDSVCGGPDGQPLPPVPPTAERCNAIDDDCDGITDEGFPGLGDACREGEGTCAVDGALQCAADGLSLVCADGVGDPIEPVVPSVEQCNGVDDDCDGVIDEGTVDDAGCSVGIGACGRSGARMCDPAQGLVCVGEPGQPTAEVCNGIDDDCDGTADEGIDGIGERCAVGVGACGSEGALGCGEDGALICLAVAGDPADELCDGVDNDCDGAVDERLDDCIMITGTSAGDCSVSPGGGDGSPLPALLGLLLGGLLAARRRWLAAAPIAAVALTMAPTSADAQDVQLFQPAAGVRGYLGVEGTRLAGEGVLVPTVHLQLASSPLVTRDRFDDALIADQDYVSRLFTLDLQLAYGLLDRLELTLDVPIHYTEGTLIEADGADGTHLGDLRVGARVALLESGPGRPIGITLDLPVSLPTGDSDGFVGEGGISASPAIAGEWNTGRVRIGSEVGVHLRSEDPRLGTLELSHELLFGLGAGVGLTEHLEALLEVAGRMPLTEIDPMSAASPVEGRAGLRWLDESGFAITGGAGTGFAYDYGAPRWRAFVGVGFVGDACGYDSDGDGIGDNCDRCPDVADADQVDSDGDGVGDACDLCPMVADAEQTDSDGDGVGDVCDNCPAVANLEQGDLDEDDLGDACDCTIEVGRVEFEFDKADIKGDQSFAVLDRMADILARYPEIRRVEVQGHTDTMGNRDYNRSLSKARAGEVSRYLGGKVQTAGLLACGYGEEQLAQWTPDETRNQANRRVQFVILDLDPAAAGKRAMCPWPVKSDRCPDPVEADWVPNVDRTGQSAARGSSSAPRAGAEAPPPVDTLRPVEPEEGTTGRPRQSPPTRPAPATRGGRSTAGRLTTDPATDPATVWQPR